MLLLDIDHFKRFNDNHGHEAGDAALQAFASVLDSRFRGSDVVCRYGGEATREELIIFEGSNLGYLTISIGVAAWPGNTDEPGQLFKLADQALCRAKAGGRDSVEVFSEA